VGRILAAVLLLLALPAPAHADTPFRLTDQVTDKVGALEGRRGEVDAALAQLRAETGLQMFVVFVKSFDAIPAASGPTRRRCAATSANGTRCWRWPPATGRTRTRWTRTSRSPTRNCPRVAATAIEPALARNDGPAR
jgi:hypothetical protein